MNANVFVPLLPFVAQIFQVLAINKTSYLPVYASNVKECTLHFFSRPRTHEHYARKTSNNKLRIEMYNSNENNTFAVVVIMAL